MGYSFNPSIVTDGLVYYIDAYNAKSYIGSGTSVNDLSKNYTNATLVNGVGYNNGTFTFDGVNDRIDCGTNFSTYLTGTNPFSIECFVYLNASQPTYADIWGNHYAYNGLVMQKYGSTIDGFNFGFGFGLGSNTWTGTVYINLKSLMYHHLIVTRASNGDIVIYDNGVPASTGNLAGALVPNTSFNFQIGTGFDLADIRYLSGNVPLFRIYNKVLNSSEVTQNFNANKGRFGL